MGTKNSSKKGGRCGVENPRRNVITFKVTDDEDMFLDTVSDIFESRSDMIRTILFDFAFALDPEKIKEYINPEAFERLKSKAQVEFVDKEE